MSSIAPSEAKAFVALKSSHFRIKKSNITSTWKIGEFLQDLGLEGVMGLV